MRRQILIITSGILLLFIGIIEVVGNKYVVKPISHYIETGSEMNRISTFGPQTDQRRLTFQVWKYYSDYRALLVINNKNDSTPAISPNLSEMVDNKPRVFLRPYFLARALSWLMGYFYTIIPPKTYLSFVNLDQDPELEIFIHQPEYGFSKQTSDVINLQNYIVDYKKGDVVLNPVSLFYSSFFVSYLRKLMIFKLILIMFILLIPIIFKEEFKSGFDTTFFVICLSSTVLVFPFGIVFCVFLLLLIWLIIKSIWRLGRKRVKYNEKIIHTLFNI